MCGGGVVTQTRSCTNPPPQHGGQNCTGNTTRTVMCNTQVCPGIYADLAFFHKLYCRLQSLLEMNSVPGKQLVQIQHSISLQQLTFLADTLEANYRQPVCAFGC